MMTAKKCIPLFHCRLSIPSGSRLHPQEDPLSIYLYLLEYVPVVGYQSLGSECLEAMLYDIYIQECGGCTGLNAT
jgi:hypothetical protein